MEVHRDTSISLTKDWDASHIGSHRRSCLEKSSALYLNSEHGVARVDPNISESCHCQGCSLKSNKSETLSSFHKQSTHLRRLGGSSGELPRHRLAQDGDNTHKNLVS